MLLTLLILIGALQPVPKEDYNHAVDYIGWQVINAYMSDYTTIRPDRKAEMEGYTVFTQEFPTDGFSIENPPSSEKVKEILSANNWKNANSSLYSRIINWKSMYDADWNGQEAAKYLRSQIDNISLKALGVEDKDYGKLKATKSRLADEMAQYFAPPAAAVEPPADATEETAAGDEYEIPEYDTDEAGSADQSVLEEESEESTSLFSNIGDGQSMLDYKINVISLVLILILIGLLLYLFSVTRKTDERLDKHRKEINDLKSEVFILGRKLNDLGVDGKLSNRLDSLEHKLDKIGSANRQQPQESNKIKTTNRVYTPPKQTAVATEPKIEEFFLSTPNGDGSFNVSSMSSSYRPSASIYKFEVSEEYGNNIALFAVAEQYEAMKDALSSPGSYIDPVCESENAFSPAARRIVNVKPGKAVRRGDQWIVRQEDKAIIRYE